tara:strand:+ start:498 stop:1259 length:762 start_codon:yes stop_codon:yes gene_type:complete
MKRISLILLLSCFAITSIWAESKPKENLAIVFIGNSITIGTGGEGGTPPPTHAVNSLRTHKKIGEVAFSNIGKSGSTTVDWLPETNTLFRNAIKAGDSLSRKADFQLIFSIKLGTNDSAIEGPNGAPVSAENYKKNMKVIMTALLEKYPKCKIVLQHPIWYSTNTYNRSKYLAEGLARLNTYIPEIDQLVKEYQSQNPGQVYLGDTKAYRYFKKHETLFKDEKGQQGIFHLHPNQAGTKILGEYWAKGILKGI